MNLTQETGILEIMIQPTYNELAPATKSAQPDPSDDRREALRQWRQQVAGTMNVRKSVCQCAMCRQMRN